MSEILEGFDTIPQTFCDGCYFDNSHKCPDVACTFVIFKKKPKDRTGIVHIGKDRKIEKGVFND